MKRIHALAVGLLAAAMSVAPATAQQDARSTRGAAAQAASTGPVTPEQLAEAQSIAQTVAPGCVVTDARFIGKGRARENNKTINTVSYEVDCQEGFGWIVVGRDQGLEPAGYNCLMAANYNEQLAAQKKPLFEACRMPANLDVNTPMQGYATAAGLACTVSDAYWMGVFPDTKVDKYEIGCADGDGWILDVPRKDSTVQLSAIDCIRASSAGGYECRFTPAADRIAVVQRMGQAGGRACAVDQIRLLGVTARGTSFYEAKCADGTPGYVLESDLQRKTVRTIDCLRATGIGGGCTLTDVSGLTRAKAGEYAARLRAVGVDCTATDMRVIGVETASNREMVELSCSNRSVGVAGLFPTSAGGTVEPYNCVAVESRAQKCVLTTKEQLMAWLTPMMAPYRADCVVSDYRVIGTSIADGTITEIACDNGRGYIVELNKLGTKIDSSVPCHIAATRGLDRCEIEGNGRAQGGGV